MIAKNLSSANAAKLVEVTSVGNHFSMTRRVETLKRMGATSEIEKEIVTKPVEQNTVEEIMIRVNTVLKPKRLNNVQTLVLQKSWSGMTYEEIAAESGYSNQHIRDVGCRLWKLLSYVLGKKISKSNLRSVLGPLSSK